MASGDSYEQLYDEQYFSGRRSFFYRLTGGYQDMPRVFDRYAADVRRYADGGRLLDVGCAYGYLLRRLDRDFETVGVDVSEHAIERARRVTPDSDLHAHNILDPLPFDDASFDAVTVTDVLEHVPHTDRILGEVARICRPGAILYVTTPNRNLIRRTLFRVPDRMEHHTNLLGFRELGRLIREAGFDPLDGWTYLNATVGIRFRTSLGPEQAWLARRAD